tara:strand:- start:1470 stop:1748 length:279 start_codon:yes stop_codon:yes gene_type:complete
MTNLAKVLLLLFVASLASNTLAHSGRTDASGGHNCSQKSINKGLCSGYHYHNNTNLDETELVGIEVSVVPKNNDKTVKQHSHDNNVHENQEG